MKEEQMLYCLIAFILGWLVSRHMGNGFSVGATLNPGNPCTNDEQCSPAKLPNERLRSKCVQPWWSLGGTHYCSCPPIMKEKGEC